MLPRSLLLIIALLSLCSARMINLGTYPFTFRGKNYTAEYVMTSSEYSFGDGCVGYYIPAIYPVNTKLDNFFKWVGSDRGRCYFSGERFPKLGEGRGTIAEKDRKAEKRKWFWIFDGKTEAIPEWMWSSTEPNNLDDRVENYVWIRGDDGMHDADGTPGRHCCMKVMPDFEKLEHPQQSGPIALQKYVIGIIITILLIILAVAACLLVRLYYGMKKIEQQRSMALLNDQLKNGSLISATDDQEDVLLERRAERIPYDSKYEIDENCLILEPNVIGEGHFGYVKRGMLHMHAGAVSDSRPFHVAVKKANNASGLEALVQELKILIALDEFSKGAPNPNVLSLVGASTANFAKGDLAVVFELCEMGDLKSYLRSNSPNFHDELVEVDVILRYKSEVIPGSQGDYLNIRRMDSESERLLPAKNNAIRTSELISFAMQVANGMKYLARIPCIHRDLAARNVLLTKNGIAKVADFGLTRQICTPNYYTAVNNFTLPYKTLALEALKTLKFTLATDVWSFGILLYEIFTLGKEPYDFRIINQRTLVTYLERGERLEKPKFCHTDIYALMRKSWDEDPSKRPDFSEWHSLLQEHLKRASPQLLCKTEDEMEKAAQDLARFSLYRREGQRMSLDVDL